MEITVSQSQARVLVTVLELKGSLDSSTYAQFEQRAQEAITAGAKDLLVDMTHVTYMSSAGIRTLTSLFNQMHSDAEIQAARKAVLGGNFKSPHLKLAGVPHRVMDVLKMAGFDEYLDIHKNRADALLAF